MTDESLDTDQIPVADQYGNVGKIPIAEYPKYQQQYGVQVIPEEAWQKHLEKQEYQNKPLQTAAAGLARGATFGVSDIIGRGLGLREHLQKLQEYNPGLSLGSNLFGAILPALFTGGESALAEGTEGVLGTAAEGGLESLLSSAASPLAQIAQKAPTSILARAGEGLTEHLAETPFIEGLSQGGTLGQLGANIIPRAIGGFAEAAPYGAGAALSEEALGDPDLSASRLMSHMGLDAILTGGFGAGLGVISGTGRTLIPKALEQFKASSKDAMDWLRNIPSQKAQSLIDQGKIPAEAIDDFQALAQSEIKRGLAKMSNYEVESKIEQVADAVSDAFSIPNNANKEFNQYTRPAFNKTHASDIYKDQGLTAFNGAKQEGDALLTNLEASKNIYTESSIGKLRRLLYDLGEDQQNLELTPGDLYENLRQYQQDVGNIAKDIPGLNAPEKELKKQFWSHYRSIGDTLKDEGSFGEVGSYQGKLQALERDNFKEGYIKQFGKDWGHIEKNDAGFIESITIDPRKVAATVKNQLKATGKVKLESLEAAQNFMQERLKLQSEIASKAPTSSFNPDNAIVNLGLKREAVRQGIDDLKWPQALKAMKSIYMPEAGYTPGALIKKGFEKLPFGIGKLAGFLPEADSPYGVLNKLAASDRIMGKMDGKIDGMIDSLITGKGLSKVEEIASKIAVPLGAEATGSILAEGLVHSFNEAIENNDGEKLNALNGELGKMLANPQELSNHLMMNLSGIQGAAPNIAAQMAGKTLKSMNMIYGASPKDKRSSLEKMVSNESWQPSDMEKHQFQNVLSALNNPLIPIHNAVNGLHMASDKAVMTQIHPELFRLQQKKLSSALATHGDKLGYNARVNIGKYFGLPTESSLDQKFIRSYAGAMGHVPNAPQAHTGIPKQHAPRMRVTGLNKMDISGRSMTATQRLSNK